jgi:hypothetical protein
MKRAVCCLTVTALILPFAGRVARADDDDKITTIAGLKNIQQIGSTEKILDLNGQPATVDSDPYKIAVAPAGFAPHLLKGDVLVSNVGNNVGMTIVKFRPFPSTGVQFNAANAGIKGPSGLAFDREKLLVANSKGNSVQILNADGTLFTSVTDPMFNNPWSVATGFTFSFAPVATFFTANKGDAKILRVDVTTVHAGVPTFKVTQIGQLDKVVGGPTKIDLLWLPFLRVGKSFLVDVLLASDPVQNRIVAFPNATAINNGTGMGQTIFQGKPLNVPGGIAINPFNNDILVVNLNDNNLVELNAVNASVVAVKTLDPLVVDAQGNNSALFGVHAIIDREENLLVYFTDDNTNTLNVLSAAPVKANVRPGDDD